MPRSEIFVSSFCQFHQPATTQKKRAVRATDYISETTVSNLHSMQLTTKIWASRINDVEKALDESLANLGTDYLDREFPSTTR